MGRVLIFENPSKPKKAPKRTSDGNEKDDKEEDEVQCVGLGSGDAWPCYWQPYFIAAWKMIQSKGSPEVSTFVEENKIEQRVLEGLVHAKAKALIEFNPMEFMAAMGSFQQRGTADAMRALGLQFGGFSRAEPKGDMKYFDKTEVVSLLGIVHLDVIVDLFRNKYVTPNNILSHSHMSRMLVMMDKLGPFLPRTEEDLVGTPWEHESARNHHELADDRWDELKDAFTLAVTMPGTVGVIY